MLNSTEAFLKPLERWVKAIREDDFNAAKVYAEQLTRDGELLAQHPGFQKCFTTHCAGVDPHHVLGRLCQFLLCAGESRSRVLRDFVRDHKPKTRS